MDPSLLLLVLFEEVLPALSYMVAPLLVEKRGNHCLAAEKLVKAAGYGLSGGAEVCP